MPLNSADFVGMNLNFKIASTGSIEILMINWVLALSG